MTVVYCHGCNINVDTAVLGMSVCLMDSGTAHDLILAVRPGTP